MDDRAILDIGALADFDVVHVTAQGAAIPDSAIRPDFHITNDGGVFGNEGVFVDLRENFSVGRNNRHAPIL